MSKVYNQIKDFKRKYKMTVAWRIKSHAKVVERHLNPGEEILYIFACQKNDSILDITSTYAVALTNKRIILAEKRLLFGYYFKAITPDMFNDLNVKVGLLWGKIIIDTVKEVVVLTNIDKRALDEIETNITEYMMEEKKKYGIQEK